MTTFGRASPIGRCSPVTVSTKIVRVGDGWVDWRRFDIECLELSHVSALLVIQGLPLKKLFEGVRFSSSVIQTEGVFTLLRADFTDPLHPPPRLKNIVLAEIMNSTEHPMEEVLGAILKDIFPSPQH